MAGRLPVRTFVLGLARRLDACTLGAALVEALPARGRCRSRYPASARSRTGQPSDSAEGRPAPQRLAGSGGDRGRPIEPVRARRSDCRGRSAGATRAPPRGPRPLPTNSRREDDLGEHRLRNLHGPVVNRYGAARPPLGAASRRGFARSGAQVAAVARPDQLRFPQRQCTVAGSLDTAGDLVIEPGAPEPRAKRKEEPAQPCGRKSGARADARCRVRTQRSSPHELSSSPAR